MSRAFRSAAALHGLIRARRAGGVDPDDGVSEKTWRDRLASRFAAELEAKPTYAMFRIIGLDDDGRELVRVDRAGPNDTVADRARRGIALTTRNSRGYFQRNRSGWARTYLRLAARSGSPQRTDRGSAQANASRRDADLWRRRQTVRPFHDQCRHAARVRPCPVIGVAWRDHIRRQQAGRLSRHSGSVARVGRLSASSPNNWKADFPHLASQDGTTQGRRGHSSGSSRTAGRNSPRALPCSAGVEWVGVIETAPNAVIMAPAASIRNTSLLVGGIAVLCAAVLALLIARS